MEYNRKKVNIIIFMLILLISLVTIFAAVDLVEEQEQTNTTDVVAENQEDQNSKTEDLPEVKQEEVKLTKAPTFSSGWAAYNYAYKIMKEKDFVLTGTAIGENDPISGISLTQYVSEKLYKVGDEYFFVDKATCGNSLGANYTKYVYNDGKNIVSRYEGQNATTVSVEEFVKKNGQAPDFLYYNLNSKTCTMDSFKIAGASYVLKITLNASVPGVFDNMEKALKNSPKAMEFAQGKSATFEIKINRKTGAFESFKVSERYYLGVNVPILGLVKSTVTTNTLFTFNWKTTDLTSFKTKLEG